MKILILSQYFWPENFSINVIADYLQSKGHQVDVLTGIPNYPQGVFYKGYGYLKRLKEDYKGVKVSRVWIKPRGQKGGDKRLILNYLTYALSASFVIPFLCNKKYDATFVYAISPITQAYPAMLLRKIKKIPMCLYVGDLWPDTLFSHGINGGVIKTLVTKACTQIYRQSESIIIVNDSFRKPVESYAGDEQKINYIPQAVEAIYCPLEADGELRSALGISEEDFIVMFAGNLGYAQAVENVVEAARYLNHYRQIHFVFVGDGSLKDACEDYCRKNSLTNCHFIGRKQQKDMPMLIASADAMLVTLKNQSNYNLTLPGRTQAFMACGKPILCSANGETARVVSDAKAGLVCNAESSKKLADIIMELYNMSPAERDQMGQNGFQYSKVNYDIHTMLEKIEKVLEEMAYEKR